MGFIEDNLLFFTDNLYSWNFGLGGALIAIFITILIAFIITRNMKHIALLILPLALAMTILKLPTPIPLLLLYGIVYLWAVFDSNPFAYIVSTISNLGFESEGIQANKLANSELKALRIHERKRLIMQNELNMEELNVMKKQKPSRYDEGTLKELATRKSQLKTAKEKQITENIKNLLETSENKKELNKQINKSRFPLLDSEK